MNLQSGKSPGPDGGPIEIIKLVGEFISLPYLLNHTTMAPSHVELGPQVPAMVGNRSLTLPASVVNSNSINTFKLLLDGNLFDLRYIFV